MKRVPGADPLVGRQAEADDVDVEEGLADEVVEPLAEQRPRRVQTGGVDEDRAGAAPVVTIPRMACRVVCGLRRGDGDLLADQRVGQRGLARVRPPDESRRTRQVRLRLRDLVPRGGCPAAPRCLPRAPRRSAVRPPPRAVVAAVTATRPVRSTEADPVPPSGHPLGHERQPVDLAGGADDRHLADAPWPMRPPTVSTSSSSSSTPNRSAEVVDGHRRLRPGTAPSPRSSTPGASRSYSSAISPTISSMMSSIVTRPAVPPYSSTTTAKWLWSRCISRSRSSTGLLSGTKCIGRISPSTGRRPASASAVDAAGDVLEVEQPEDVVACPRRRPGSGRTRSAGTSDIAWRSVLLVVDGHHVGARHHDLARDRVAQLEDGVDHLPLVGLDDRGLGGQVEQVAQLGLGLERAVAVALAGSHRVAERDEHPRDRPEDAAQPDGEGRRRQGHRVEVLPPQGARGDPGDDERHDGHDGDRDEQADRRRAVVCRTATVMRTALAASATTRRKASTAR